MKDKVWVVVAILGTGLLVVGIAGLILIGRRDKIVPTLEIRSPIVSTSTTKDTSATTQPTTDVQTPVVTQMPEVDAGKKISEKYYVYSEDLLETFLDSNTRVILFFHANWCPTCRAAEKDIVQNHANLPANVVILKVDYDTSTDLKTKYNVIAQHTFVLLNTRAESAKQWRGGDVEDIVKNLNSN